MDILMKAKQVEKAKIMAKERKGGKGGIGKKKC